MPSLQILISTTLSRLPAVEAVLLPPHAGVSYVVSCQGVPPDEPFLPPFTRDDVAFFPMAGLGLSRNRNAAFKHATAPYLLLCDDDERLCPQTVLGIAEDFHWHPRWDIIQYQTSGAGKHYPSPYVSSVELAMRRAVAEAVSFDERFGLGSPELACGEEEVFVSDALRRGFSLGRLPKVVCTLASEGTGKGFLASEKVQRSKGAVFAYVHGAARARLLCLREALSWSLRGKVSPLPMLRNMFWGIRYVKP